MNYIKPAFFNGVYGHKVNYFKSFDSIIRSSENKMDAIFVADVQLYQQQLTASASEWQSRKHACHRSDLPIRF